MIEAPAPLGRYKHLPPMVRESVRLAAEETECDVLDVIRGGKLSARVTRARELISRDLRKRGFSLPEIGRYLGIHHTTVMHLLRNGTSTAKRDHGVIPVPDFSGEWAI